MIVQRAGAIIHGVFVNRAVRMYVSNDMPVRMVLSVAGVVVAVGTRGRLRDECALKGKRHRRRNHDDIGEPTKPGERTSAQRVTSTYLQSRNR
jgi:hypothetical protein